MLSKGKLYIYSTEGEPSFHLFRFLMCIGATAARALKSVLQGILLSSEGITSFFTEKLNSMNLLMYMAPIAVVILHPATLFMEENVVGITIALARKDVLGNAKGAAAVVVLIMIFWNPVSVTGMLGYLLTVLGVILY
nr:probable sugar phosphate/phosphate translocator At3g11320 [Tanacetum cinerariifolium]